MATFAAISLTIALAVAAYVVWRSRRRALANRLMHRIADAMESLDRDVDPVIESPELLSPPRALLGATLAGRAAAFARACRPYADGVRTGVDRSHAFALGEAVLRDLRDVATGRRHDLVNRS